MRRSCFAKWFLLFLFPLLLWGGGVHKSAIFYYGSDISWPLVGAHDYIVVQPDHIDEYTHGFRTYRNKVYAYVSVGEAEEGQWYYSKIEKKWIIARNGAWKSDVMDLANPAYRRFFLDRVIGRLKQRGFENLFLDTLDSYRLAKLTEKERERQRKGLVALIKGVKARWPDTKIILNRGFELIPELKGMVVAVAAESLYRGIGGKELRYRPVKAKEREWLLARMKKAAEKGLDLIDIEYLPPEKLAKEGPKLLEKVSDRGIIGYVTDRDLLHYGITVNKVAKREILMLYDGTSYAREYQAAHQYGSLPAEYLGYVPILADIRHGLPPHAWERYAGVVVWLDRPYAHPKKLARWIVENASEGLKTLILGISPFPYDTKQALAMLGMDAVKNSEAMETFHVGSVQAGKMMNYEQKIYPKYHETLLRPKNGRALYSYTNGEGERDVLAALMPWGGFALDEASMVEFNGDNIWTVNPFELYERALKLPSIPIPDPTTENGRRLLFTHIDGDAFIDRVEWDQSRFASEVIRDEILARYPIPHSVSIVEGEIAPYGLYPAISKKMEAIARSIYRLPNVEAATHTFSHPFVWGAIDEKGDLPLKYRLPIENYHFSVDREIEGSLAYINTKLLPPYKPKAKTVFWSGDCLPTEKILDYVYRHDLLNINGGDTYITKAHPWLSLVSPYGIRKGPYWQIYCGEQNENLYTNEWHGPFWGFKNAIQTYEMTDYPKRFKPIDIYYHFYSGSKRASLNALKTVFDWAMKQDVMPIYTTEFIPKVMAFYDTSIERLENGWRVHGLGALRTLRLRGGETPDIARSEGVVGYRKLPQGLYLHLSGSDEISLHEGPTEGVGAYLLSSNGKVGGYRKRPDGFSIDLMAHVPLEAVIKMGKECRVVASPLHLSLRRQEGRVYLRYRTVKRAHFDVQCP
ncbi:endo alpha-1,4 polygalactosaminidase [Hydrogenimonas sp. SS33]|uniref:endo alpha-1,4 polygalactosaminidase n=1 Tax=Hydrogenimonas leucolamina TaxID=2954236 RepID=UPI00336C29B7